MASGFLASFFGLFEPLQQPGHERGNAHRSR